jgi:Xaa-Pro aminopeptidase
MQSSFFKGNRRELYARLGGSAVVIVGSGDVYRKTNDQYFLHYTDRNFLYLTGIEQENATLLALGETETLFIPPPDMLAERWNGERVKSKDATDISGIENIKYEGEFAAALDRALQSGNYEAVYLPLVKFKAGEPDSLAFRMAKYIRDRFPHITIKDLMPHIKALRLIKKPCEIEAMREAQKITREGILAMMRAAKPGIKEYELKAEFDYALLKNGVMEAASQPIISAGKNNFCIHYNAYSGTAMDGDMVLNDVGAVFDNLMNDVSRGWPVNGKFSDKQRLLYQCAVDTSVHMFGLIKPGMPMGDVDGIIRKYNCERLMDTGLLKNPDDIGKYMWHGGAHHVGYDVHDVVAIRPDTPIAPGMVFCVDIGIYAEEWGIGFRLEDNCLVTETGCENLSAITPSSVEDIEAVMAG